MDASSVAGNLESTTPCLNDIELSGIVSKSHVKYFLLVSSVGSSACANQHSHLMAKTMETWWTVTTLWNVISASCSECCPWWLKSASACQPMLQLKLPRTASQIWKYSYDFCNNFEGGTQLEVEVQLQTMRQHLRRCISHVDSLGKCLSVKSERNKDGLWRNLYLNIVFFSFCSK